MNQICLEISQKIESLAEFEFPNEKNEVIKIKRKWDIQLRSYSFWNNNEGKSYLNQYMNALKYKYQQGIQELIQDGMPASEITPYYQTIRRYNHKKLWRMIGIPICVISIIFVFVLTSINILKESLLEIWNKHQRQMSAVELNAILGRGICFSKIEKAHRILVTGMSPSFRQGDPAQENFVCEYEYQGIVEGGEDRYFLAFDKLFPEAYKREVAYMDLLNFRETDQNTVWKFCKDPKGFELVAGNLRLSQLFIEQVVRPRLIMVKNRGSWCFWGKEAKTDENIWMGYRFEHLESLPCGDLCRITGLIDHPGRVSHDCLLETNLKGTLVLFTSHFQYCATEKLPTPELLARLCGMM